MWKGFIKNAVEKEVSNVEFYLNQKGLSHKEAWKKVFEESCFGSKVWNAIKKQYWTYL